MFRSHLRAMAARCCSALPLLVAPAATWGQSPPPNDNCSNAISIGPGAVNGTNVGATNDGISNCGDEGSGQDVWYSYVPATTGTLVVNTCAGANFDTVITVFVACDCPPTRAELVACNDDTCGLQSEVSLVVGAGLPYLIRVSGFNDDEGGTFTLTLTGPATGAVADTDHNGTPDICETPSNDHCTDALVIGPGSYVGSTRYATSDQVEPSCGNDGIYDVWYRYVPSTDGTLILNTLGSSFDTVLTVFRFVCVCPPVDEVGCNDDCGIVDGGYVRQSCLEVSVTAGVCYVIHIVGNEVDDVGLFVLNVSGPALANLPDNNHDGIPDPCQSCTVTCPGDITAYSIPGNDSVVVEFEVTVSGSCDPTLDLVCDHPSGSSFPLGDTLVTCCLREDTFGTEPNTPCGGCCSFTITVLRGEDCNGNGIADIPDILSGFSLDCNDDWIPDECDCCWDNGRAPIIDTIAADPPPVNGELSHEGGGAGDAAKVADDFYFCPGQITKVTAFFGQVITNSYHDGANDFRHARLEFYQDCDGAPVSTPFKTFTNSVIINSVNLPDGFSLVTYRFDLCDEHLWLDGGKTYWAALIGLSDNINGTDLSFWVAAPDSPPILGSIPRKAIGTRGTGHNWMTFNYGPWMSLEECCIGCVNMSFWLSCEHCDVVWDNGPADTNPATKGGTPSGAAGPAEAEAADQFVVKPCNDREVCLIQAWVWSNCQLTEEELEHPCPDCAFINLYRNECDLPSLETPCFFELTPTHIIRTTTTTTIDGRTVILYCLEYETNTESDGTNTGNGGGSPLTLHEGTNYWISAGIHGDGTFATRSYFAYPSNCNRCPILINPGVKRTISATGAISPWIDSGHEYAFRIAVHPFATRIMLPPGTDQGGSGGGGGGSFCAADFNNSGQANIEDIFAFLATWFSGCP